jgi:hypothetical protein
MYGADDAAVLEFSERQRAATGWNNDTVKLEHSCS